MCEYGTVLLDVVCGVLLQCLHEIVNRPHVAFERAIQNAFQHARNLPIRDGVAGEIDNLIAHARFEEHDLRCQRTDVVRCRERHAVLEAAQGVHCVVVEVDDLEHRLEQEAGEHACRDDDPFSVVLGAQQLTHIQLGIEQILGAAPANHFEIHAKLPGEVALHAGFECGGCQLHRGFSARDHARAADHGIEACEDLGKLID